MIIYDETDGPTMQLELPVEVVETLIEIAYRHITPAMGLDGAFIDELRGQLAAHKAKPEAEPADTITLAEHARAMLSRPQARS